MLIETVPKDEPWRMVQRAIKAAVEFYEQNINETTEGKNE